MATSPSGDSRIRTWVLFVAGLVFLAKFALYSPTTLNPLLTTLIAGCLFGPSVFSIWGGKDDK